MILQLIKTTLISSVALLSAQKKLQSAPLSRSIKKRNDTQSAVIHPKAVLTGRCHFPSAILHYNRKFLKNQEGCRLIISRNCFKKLTDILLHPPQSLKQRPEPLYPHFVMWPRCNPLSFLCRCHCHQ